MNQIHNLLDLGITAELFQGQTTWDIFS